MAKKPTKPTKPKKPKLVVVPKPDTASGAVPDESWMTPLSPPKPEPAIEEPKPAKYKYAPYTPEEVEGLQVEVFDLSKMTLDALARKARRGFDACKAGRAQWLTGTMKLANSLAEARERIPADKEFSKWLTKAKLQPPNLSKDDRAALVWIGLHASTAAGFLHDNPDRWSWRLCVEALKEPVVSQAAKPDEVSQAGKPTAGEAADAIMAENFPQAWPKAAEPQMAIDSGAEVKEPEPIYPDPPKSPKQPTVSSKMADVLKALAAIETAALDGAPTVKAEGMAGYLKSKGIHASTVEAVGEWVLAVAAAMDAPKPTMN